jgi:uncharacterized protein involved in high-affinity Fe2+ transport
VQERWASTIVVVLILGGVVAVLALNLNLKGRSAVQAPANELIHSQSERDSQSTSTPAAVVRQPAGFREYPIGDEAQKNGMLIKAVWLPPVQMEGMAPSTSAKVIHLEADVHATEGNRNGFAKDEFVPYLVVDYSIVPADKKAVGTTLTPIGGRLTPMVARDGWHYGATIEMPGPGRYTLTYALKPPSAAGAGRHVDAATGVDPWWKPFEVSFDWEFEPGG